MTGHSGFDYGTMGWSFRMTPQYRPCRMVVDIEYLFTSAESELKLAIIPTMSGATKNVMNYMNGLATPSP
jgi:hypothetical protein